MSQSTPITVSQLNQYLKGVLESDLNLRGVAVIGEISNLTMHGSGHVYLRLKDENGVLSAVMFRSSASKLRLRPENGMKVIANGSISVFEKTGVYQLYITEMKQDGEGDLYVAFEQLKKQLAAAGIFSDAHKKPIPQMPQKIGVITSHTGAAVRDIIQILGRRFPLSEVVVYPAIVQGDSAPLSLMQGLDYFERIETVDVIIIGRGGGSIEDLWGFNDPDLALAIYNCETPVISAVGHETDFTICDFVADLRAPTPSGAAELAVPEQENLKNAIAQFQNRLFTSLDRKMLSARERLERYANSKVLNDPHAFTDKPYMILDHLNDKLVRAIQGRHDEQKNLLEKYIAKLDALSPLKIMQRGFSAARDEHGQLVRSVKRLTEQDKLYLRFTDGTVKCCVEEIVKDSAFDEQ